MNDRYIINPDGYLGLSGVVDRDDLLDSYREHLDADGPVVLAGLDYWPSEVLPDIDPIAYQCGFRDWLDDLLADGELVEYKEGHEWLREGDDDDTDMSIDTTSDTPTTQTSDAPEMDWNAREAQPYCRCGEVRMYQGDVLDIEGGAWDRLMAWARTHFPDMAGVSSEFADAILDELREEGACMCEVDDDDFMRALHSIQPDADEEDDGDSE